MIEHNHTVPHGQRLRFTARHMQEGDTQALAYCPQLIAHAGAQICIKCTQRLIQQDEFWLCHQGPCQSHALFLPAGNLTDAAPFQT